MPLYIQCGIYLLLVEFFCSCPLVTDIQEYKEILAAYNIN
jgi:hypothetical protein